MLKYIIFVLITLYSYSSTYWFSDIEYNWYKDSILELKEDEVVNGFENDRFLPHATISRVELLKIIMNSAESQKYETGVPCFTDIPVGSWYEKYVCAWVDQWITNGYADGTFNPEWTVTVLEALAFGARAFDLDVESLWEWDVWYEKYQAFAHLHNIIPKHAYTKDTLISRGQASEIISRIKNYASGKQNDYKSLWCSIDPALKSWSYNIEINGLSRNYLLYVPSWMQRDKEMSLAIAFHGRTNNNSMVRDYMQLWWGRYWYKQNDFIVAYPAWLWAGPYSWSQYENIEFFDAIVSELSEKLCINRDKVFSVGHSLGSYMSNKVSCQRWDVIRAMAWVASSWFKAKCTWPVSSLITHLPWDPLAAYSGGQRAYAIRSEVNQCESGEKQMNIWDLRSCTQKTSCSLWNTAIFCNSYDTYGNDQHSWPKNGSDDILDFFRDIEEYSN